MLAHRQTSNVDAFERAGLALDADQFPNGDEGGCLVTPEELLTNGLPFNRKERYFTGTIFPALVLGESLERLSRLFERLGIEAATPYWGVGVANTQVFTEYGAAESILAGDPLFGETSLLRDTPDIVMYQPGRLLVGIEAKMFEQPSRADLDTQLARQREVLLPLAAHLALSAEDVHQVLLLPEQTASRVGPLPSPILSLTWTEVAELYADGPMWALDVLVHALRNWHGLVGSSHGAGAHVYLTGAEIVRQYRTGELSGAVVGRQWGGLAGSRLKQDRSSGTWTTWPYQVRYEEEPPNGNWFPVEDFVRFMTDEVPLTLRHLLGWQLARDAARVFGDQFLIRERHPAGGQSDVFELSRRDGFGLDKPAVWLGRLGSIKTSTPSRIDCGWEALVTDTGRASLLAEIGPYLQLVADDHRDGLQGQQAGLEAIVTVLGLVAGGVLDQEVRIVSAALDTSGYQDPTGWRRELLSRFPTATALIERNARLLEPDDWCWWVMVDAVVGSPLALIDLWGRIWKPDEVNPSADLVHDGAGSLVAALLGAAMVPPRD